MKKLGILFTTLFVVAISLTSCKKVETTVSPQDTANVDSIVVDSIKVDTTSTKF